MFTENSMSSQALRQLSLFGLAKHVAVFLIYYGSLEPFFLLLIFYLILFTFRFSSVLLRDQKWGMDLLGISGFFSQRAHTRNFSGSHPRVTFLATHRLFLFSSQYDDSSAISCCPYCTSCTTPTEACCPDHARISQSKEVKISYPGNSF